LSLNNPARLAKVIVLALVLTTILAVGFWLTYPLFLVCTTVGGTYEKFGGSPELCTVAMQSSASVFLAILLSVTLYFYRTLSVSNESFASDRIYPDFRRHPLLYGALMLLSLYLTPHLWGLFGSKSCILALNSGRTFAWHCYARHVVSPVIPWILIIGSALAATHKLNEKK
jgi:hypothetical protein